MKACINEFEPNTSQANYSEGFWRITSQTNAKIEDCSVVIWTKNEVAGGGLSLKVLVCNRHYFSCIKWRQQGKVSLWKESLEGHWVCVSDVYRGQGQETQ
ncbi:GTPase-activating protein S13 [Porites harrisoni]